MKKSLVAVVFPSHRESPTAPETISLDQTLAVLHSYSLETGRRTLAPAGAKRHAGHIAPTSVSS